MKLTGLCIDANIIIASTIPTETWNKPSKEVINFIFKENIILFEPAVVIYEVASAFHQKYFLKEFNSDECDKRIDYLDQLPILLQWQTGFLQKANDYAMQFSTKRIYDFCYLAVAEARNIPLITLDKTFLKNARKIYNKVYSVNEFLESNHK